ncbi:MAG: gluconate 2-dehydrogenase subunit 3 family protein [Bryobacteraceae bacterium]
MIDEVSTFQEMESSFQVRGPKFFSEGQFALLRFICDFIIPADAESGGATEAGAPEFIDLISSENTTWQIKIGGGLMWLDAHCFSQWRCVFLELDPSQQITILSSLAWRKNSVSDPALQPGVEMFAFVRKLTVDAFVTSEIGERYLGYMGNTRLHGFPGCPPLPE